MFLLCVNIYRPLNSILITSEEHRHLNPDSKHIMFSIKLHLIYANCVVVAFNCCISASVFPVKCPCVLRKTLVNKNV